MSELRVNFRTPSGEIIVADRFLVWTSVHGKKERICNMSNGHLFNLFWYLWRRVKLLYLSERNAAFDIVLCAIVREELMKYRKEPDPIMSYDPEQDPLFKKTSASLQEPSRGMGDMGFGGIQAQDHNRPRSTGDVEMKTIELPCHGIVITLDGTGGGSISSDLHEELWDPQSAPDSIEEEKMEDENAEKAEHNAAVDGMESLILALACTGQYDLTCPSFIEAVETAAQAIGNNY